MYTLKSNTRPELGIMLRLPAAVCAGILGLKEFTEGNLVTSYGLFTFAFVEGISGVMDVRQVITKKLAWRRYYNEKAKKKE